MMRAIWTLGHSNHGIDRFLGLLGGPSIKQVADVRRFPGSRRHPQFRREAMEWRLGEAGIAYRHFASLGGRRAGRTPGSLNTGWRVEAFNAYADYMDTLEFQAALADLERFAESRATAILCAEALPWRCHRRLIADALLVRGWSVWDIMTADKAEPHRLTDFARLVGGRLTYPGTPLFSPIDRSVHPEPDEGGRPCPRVS